MPSSEVLQLVKEAIKKKPKVIWLQEGIHNLEAEDIARKKGIEVIFNRCMLKEHQRLMPSIEKSGSEYFTKLKEYDDSTLQQLYDDYYFQSSNYEKYKNWYVKAEFVKNILSSKKILDIGCADGRLVIELSKLGIESYGIDGSTYILNQANPKIKNRLLQVNLNEKFPFEDNHFDGITSLHTIEHVHNLDNFMKELFRIMKEGGKAWIVTPDTPKEKHNPYDVNLKTLKEWKKFFLQYGFTVKKQKQYGFLDMKGKLAPLRLYKLPEPVRTWVKYSIYWYLNNFVKNKNDGKEASFLLIKPNKN
jgi:ubiquinone/menaquinone biosynthesis C-methylase UbiE